MTVPHQRVAGEGPNREIGGQTRVPRRIGRGDGRAVVRVGRPRVSPPMAAGGAGCLRVQRSRVLRGRDERRRSRKHGGERRMKAGGRAAGGASPVDSPAGGRTEVRSDSPAGGRDGGSWGTIYCCELGTGRWGQKPAAVENLMKKTRRG
jgi:hypothetical protein